MRTRNNKPRKHNKSISRWAKDHQTLLQRVNFGAHGPDPHWRKKRAYGKWRATCLARDNYRCQRCGAPATTVHHRIPASVCKDLRYHPDNGLSLCDACHAREPHQFDPAFWEKMTRGR